MSNYKNANIVNFVYYEKTLLFDHTVSFVSQKQVVKI